jgi:hypothetical protein
VTVKLLISHREQVKLADRKFRLYFGSLG